MDETKPGQPVVAIHFRPNIEKKVTDMDLVHLKKLPNLRAVELSSQAVTDAGLHHLAVLDQLEELNLNRNQVTAAGVIRQSAERHGNRVANHLARPAGPLTRQCPCPINTRTADEILGESAAEARANYAETERRLGYKPQVNRSQ